MLYEEQKNNKVRLDLELAKSWDALEKLLVDNGAKKWETSEIEREMRHTSVELFLSNIAVCDALKFPKDAFIERFTDCTDRLSIEFLSAFEGMDKVEHLKHELQDVSSSFKSYEECVKKHHKPKECQYKHIDALEEAHFSGVRVLHPYSDV